MSASELLAPYRALMRDERHGELTLRLLEWSLQRTFRRQEPGVYAREAYTSSTYDLYCCPPGATLEEHLLAGRLLLCIFKADDGPTAELDAFLDTPEDAPCAPTELRACHEGWLEALRREGRDTEGPRAAFREMCAWMRVERGLDPRTVTEARYRELRRHTIAVPAYLACWTAIRGLTLSEYAREALRHSGLLEVAVELVYISNDLGSLEKDAEAARKQSAGSDLNLVLLRAREMGSHPEALRQVVALYHERAQDFARLRAELAGTEHWHEHSVRDSVEMLRRVTNGNLGAIRHLMAMRYPGALALLEGLPEVAPLLLA